MASREYLVQTSDSGQELGLDPPNSESYFRSVPRAHYVNRLSAALVAYQQQNDLNGLELAQLMGVTHTALFVLVRGLAFPARDTVRRCAEVLLWTLDEVGAFLLGLPTEPLAYLEAEPE